MVDKILLLGSGELGKELVISLKRLGQYVVACDSYKGAPAMQVADEYEVFDMLDGEALARVVAKHQPKLVVPEVESIRTEKFYDFEKEGITVVPSAKAANFTMNRKLIRDLAAKELGLRTAKYLYANNLSDFKNAVNEIGFPCVVKPLMSSSGKGQSVLKSQVDIENAWNAAMEGSRGDVKEVIIEAFVDFHTEITLLTVTQKNGATLFCPPIGHRQERGDYQESWQPCAISDEDFKASCEMADKITQALEGAGIWGVEFFIANDGVYFSELSPRPHDTGMVTLAGTQNLSEFELHARAILGLPIHEVTLEKAGVSSVILAMGTSTKTPTFKGVSEALDQANLDIRLFGKPNTRPYRRMGVVLVNGPVDSDVKVLRDTGAKAASKVKVQ
ncbi:formate-dependent phosphoribosylglycinamide formyltransferase [Luteibaculum oceani]|uniref:Formate-dependent phosphoribosylglycinamide formyltransferase n=1 Tax=Luteibaculum oceani TaxID=1294296 RepID=A0A5C6V4S0_9FLAO|nr:formate-dependent phosphoribosylglycinamide formyltransferase [Luteibaculum oceani]TXC78515.1 formate-dependent phosphoribosylglycinamide formyltransferase [Luteibaculum oceani]